MKFFRLSTKHPSAKYPERSTLNSMGYDLTAVDNGEEIGSCLIYDTGVKLKDLPPNHGVLLVPRSSIFKTDLRLANSIGVIDPDYKDTIKVIFDYDHGVAFGDLKKYFKGDRIAQLLVVPYAQEIEDLPPTAVRQGGFGSTGKKAFKKPKSKKEKK